MATKKAKKTTSSDEKPLKPENLNLKKQDAPVFRNTKLEAALERCKEAITMNKNKVAITKKTEKQLANDINNVTSDVKSILSDLKKHLGSMKNIGKMDISQEKIEVVSKQFFSNKLLTDGKATRITQNKSQNNQNQKNIQQNTKGGPGNASTKKVESGVKLTRTRRRSPSGTERRGTNKGSTNRA